MGKKARKKDLYPPKGTADLEKDHGRPGIFSLATPFGWGSIDTIRDLEGRDYETEGN